MEHFTVFNNKYLIDVKGESVQPICDHYVQQSAKREWRTVKIDALLKNLVTILNKAILSKAPKTSSFRVVEDVKRLILRTHA